MTLPNTDIPLIAAALVFIAIFLLSIGLLIYFKQMAYRRELIEKLKNAGVNEVFSEAEAAPLSLSDDTKKPALNFLNALGMKFKTKVPKDETATKFKFLRAGMRSRNAVTAFLGMKVLLSVAFPMGFLVVIVIYFQTVESSKVLLGAAFFMLLGMALPDFWLRMKTAGRKERIEKAFPDALDLLVVCVEAGMGLDAAFHRVGKELALTHPDLSDELQLMNLELRAGKPRRSALRNFAKRTDIDDVNSLVTMLLQTDRFGTSVAQSLRVFSETFRTVRYQRAEEVAAKIATKLIFPMALCIFPSFFVVAVGPAVIQIYRMFSESVM